MMDSKTIIAETDKYYLPVFSRYKVAFTHGKGCYLYDAEGKAYLDFLGGIAVNALGYAHPVLVKALSEQAAKLTHCSNIFYTDIQAKAVKLISEVTGFDRVFLANSGAEANEGAMKLARKYGVSMDPCKFKDYFCRRIFPWPYI
jgi:acetylornithine/N-succinyldiaminopimelate aminotransferase